VGPGAGLDNVENRKFLTLPVLKLKPLDPPARIQSVYRLRYPGVKVMKDGKYFMELCKTLVTAPVLKSHGSVFKFKSGDRLL
jgi:hypothetical protein